MALPFIGLIPGIVAGIMTNFGGKNITTTKTDFDTSIVDKTVNDIKQTVITESNLDAKQQCTERVKFGDIKLKDCTLNISNVCKSFANSVMSIDVSQEAVVNEDQEQAIRNDIMKQIAQKNKDLNLFQTNTVNDVTSVTNNIVSIINNKVKQDIETMQNTFVEQDGQLVFNADNLECENGELNISNEVILDAFTSTDTTAIQNAIIDSTNTTDILDKYKLDVKQTNIGVNLVGVLVVVAIIIALVMFGPVAFGSTAGITILGPILFIASIALFIYFMFQGLTGYAFISVIVMWGLLVTLMITGAFNSTSSKSSDASESTSSAEQQLIVLNPQPKSMLEQQVSPTVSLVSTNSV